MTDVDSPLAATNSLTAVYARYVEWGDRLARGDGPQTPDDSLDALLALAETDEELLARAIDLAESLKAHSVDGLPLEVEPEYRFVADCVEAVPDLALLRERLANRSAQLLAVKSDPERKKPAQYSTKLPEPFEAQWISVREASKLLFNQVQIYNAQMQATAFERAAELGGHTHESTTHRGDDGSVTRTVTVTFDRRDDGRRTWWQRLTRRRT